MQNMPIGIFRGDDTDAFSYQTIVGTINTDLDLTGCKAVFRYLGFSMEFDPIPEDKKLTIIIPADETKKFPPGLGYASLRVYDQEGRLKTFSNRIMVFVATKTPMFGSDEFEVDFNVRAKLEPLRFFVGPNPDDFDEYRGYVEKVIDRASATKYGLAILLDAIDSDLGANDGAAATPVAVKAAYAAIIEELTNNYYTATETDEAIDRVAAYYITYTAAGAAFPTHAALAGAQTVYSGGEVRVPTRNDYCVVLADETHGGSEYRYIYAVAEGETTGSWQPQFPVGGVMTVDQTVTKNSANPVSSGGIWSAIWGALFPLPTGFTSLYDWCVAQLAGKASKSDATLTPIYSNTPTFSEWTYSGIPDGWILENPPRLVTDPEILQYYNWEVDFFTGEVSQVLYSTSAIDSNEVVFDIPEGGTVTSTRTRTDISYRLGPDEQTNPNRNKPLASEAEAEALRTGKLDKSAVVAPSSSATAGQAADAKATGDALALIAPDWVQTSAYSAYDCVKYNGAYYYAKTGIAANTAWDADNWGSLANLAAVVKKFLPLAGGEISGDLLVDGRIDISAFFSIVKSLAAGLVFVGRINNVERRALLPLSSASDSASGSVIAFLQNLAPDYDATATYALNNLCVKNAKLYRCTTAITTAEAWTPAHWTAATIEDVLAALRTGKANRAANPTAGNLAALDANGNPTDSTIPAADVAVKSNIPYDLVTKTIANGEVTLDDRAANAVTISATLSPNTLTVNFPTATTTGKVRDFALRLNIASGVTAPELAWPQGVTLENDGGKVPEITDGGTSGSSTILYFSETENNGTTAKFLVKGETLTAIAQA